MQCDIFIYDSSLHFKFEYNSQKAFNYITIILLRISNLIMFFNYFPAHRDVLRKTSAQPTNNRFFKVTNIIDVAIPLSLFARL